MRLPLPFRLLSSPYRLTIALECIAALGLARLGLKLTRLPILSTLGCRLFAVLAFSGRMELSERQARELAHCVRRACVFLPGMLCLQQSLAVQWLIVRHGGACIVHVGVASREGTFKSHAWASCGGKVLIGGADAAQEYREILRVASPERLASQTRNRRARSTAPETE